MLCFRLGIKGLISITCTCRVQNPDIPRTGRVGAAHGRAAGRGGAGQDGTPTDRSAQVTTPTFVPSKASHTILLNDFSEARTSKTLCTPMGEQKPRLTSGLSAGRNVSSFLVADQWTGAILSLNPFHTKHVKELTRNPCRMIEKSNERCPAGLRAHFVLGCPPENKRFLIYII